MKLSKLKQYIWNFIYEFFSKFQNFLLRNKIIKHSGRQPYHIGWVAPEKTLEDLKLHLHTNWGFGNHFIAWTDDDQVLSWRKLVDFENQYHLRIYKDGEIKGHYEYTPEAHPVNHLLEKGEKEVKDKFLNFLGEFCVTKKYISQLERDPQAFNPDSEITIESEGNN